MEEIMSPRLLRSEVPDYLKTAYGITVAETTLATWASRGGGPRFQKDGPRSIYPIDEIDACQHRQYADAARSD